MSYVIAWLIVIPLFYYVFVFWGRLLRAGIVRGAKLVAPLGRSRDEPEEWHPGGAAHPPWGVDGD